MCACQKKNALTNFCVTEVFKQTLKAFNNIDILINNAGILNETIWEKETAINIVKFIR